MEKSHDDDDDSSDNSRNHYFKVISDWNHGGVQEGLLNPLQTRSRIGIVSYSTRPYNLRFNQQWSAHCFRAEGSCSVPTMHAHVFPTRQSNEVSLPGMYFLDALGTTEPLAHLHIPDARLTIGNSCHILINRHCLISMAAVDALTLKNTGLQFSKLFVNITSVNQRRRLISNSSPGLCHF